jgi:hypothetical protein
MGATRSEAKQAGLTLDAGALIAIERGDRRMIALIQTMGAKGGCFRIPAGVVGQVWRNPERQVLLARFLRLRNVSVRHLDDQLARACGVLCAAARTRDVIDASVVITAREHRDAIVTSDPDDIRRLDRTVSIHRI